jgi:hypothetical protein
MLQVRVSGSLGSPLQLQLTDPDGNTVTADTGSVLLQQAAQRPLSEADVVASVGQLGDNTLAPASVDVSGLLLDQGRHEGVQVAGCTSLVVICILRQTVLG